MSGSRPVWHQLDGESDKAFAAFNMYRTMPVQTRSIFAVAEQWGAKISPRRRHRRDAPSQFRAWASRYSWVLRTRAFEAAMLDHASLLLHRERIRAAGRVSAEATDGGQRSAAAKDECQRVAEPAGHESPPLDSRVRGYDETAFPNVPSPRGHVTPISSSRSANHGMTAGLAAPPLSGPTEIGKD